MRIVKLKGGLGNQMFQYSFARLLQNVCNDDVKLDMSLYENNKEDMIRRPRILRYNLQLDLATRKDIENVCILKHPQNIKDLYYKPSIAIESIINRKYYLEKNRKYRKVDNLLQYTYYDGYWQSYRYVDAIWEILKTDYTLKNELKREDIANKIIATNSVFVGIRKGDYSSRRKHYGNLDSSYYLNAMKYISERIDSPVFYIFSNDLGWVYKNVDFNKYKVVFIENYNDDFEEMQLMALCKHSIISNSTFHWWGARLYEYEGKYVIAPAKWFWDRAPIDIIPNQWIRL